MPYDAQNQIVQIMDAGAMRESFIDIGSARFKINKDLALRTLLFGALFYIINDDLVRHLLNRFRTIIPIGVLQTLIFCVIYIIISINIDIDISTQTNK